MARTPSIQLDRSQIEVCTSFEEGERKDRFISLSDLKDNKRAAGRLKDLADLEALSDETASG